MKRRLTTSLIALAGASALVLSGCDETQNDKKDPTAKDVKREAGEAADAAGKFAQNQVATFKSEMAAQLEAVESEIREIEADSEDLAEEARLELEAVTRSLRAQRDELRERLNAAKADSQEAWNDVKGGLERGWNNLRSAIDDAKDRFDPDNGG